MTIGGLNQFSAAANLKHIQWRMKKNALVSLLWVWTERQESIIILRRKETSETQGPCVKTVKLILIVLTAFIFVLYTLAFENKVHSNYRHIKLIIDKNI